MKTPAFSTESCCSTSSAAAYDHISWDASIIAEKERFETDRSSARMFRREIFFMSSIIRGLKPIGRLFDQWVHSISECLEIARGTNRGTRAPLSTSSAPLIAVRALSPMM